jgi:hypothetical protein
MEELQTGENAILLEEIDRDPAILGEIKRSLRKFALGDIIKMDECGWPIAGFILASCFIDHISTFRWGKKVTWQTFTDFIDQYLPDRYKDIKLKEDLRNKLVHNYSVGEKYMLVAQSPQAHFEKQGDKFYLNLGNFANDLKSALDRYELELEIPGEIPDNAYRWYKMGNRIITG